MWRQVVSQTPQESTQIDSGHPYAKAASQLNELIRSGRSLSGNERNCFFLNMEGKRFATASSIGGFDFKDDGRAVAECDWDFDGDVDLWIANRTAPQIRYLENQFGSENNFVAFRLQGTRSNRDAIGARVEIKTDATAAILMKGLRAGEGFLTQCSKLVHFGLGNANTVTQIVVHWPNGDAERFPTREVNAYYSLVEGSGKAVRWQPPSLTDRKNTIQLRPSVPIESMATTNPLAIPMPLPPLQYRDPSGAVVDATEGIDSFRIVNLWASWCEPCLKELSEWQSNRELLDKKSIGVLAVSVESEGQSELKTLTERGIALESGVATPAMLEVVQLVHNAIYDHHQRLPVPTSLLLNSDGHLVGIIKGNATTDQICEALEQTSNPDPDSRLPFPGRWIGRLRDYKFASLASELWDAGFEDEALKLADRINSTESRDELIKVRTSLAHRLKLASRIQESMNQLQAAYKIAPKNADVNLRIGVLQAEYGKLPLAVGHFLISIENSETPRADVHAALGASFRRLGRLAEAEYHLKQAVQIDPNLAPAVHGLGLLHAAQSRMDEAVRTLQQAVSLDPANNSYRINYATALSQAGHSEQALDELDAVLQIDPDSLPARIYKGEVYALSGRLKEAIGELSSVVDRSPKATRVWLRLGELQETAGRHRAALASYRQVSSLSPEDPRATVKVAWVLATAPEDDLRNGDMAVTLARSAVEKTGSSDPMALDALAAACAESGQFAEAVALCDKAISLLKSKRDDAIRADIEGRRNLYSNQMPFRSKGENGD